MQARLLGGRHLRRQAVRLIASLANVVDAKSIVYNCVGTCSSCSWRGNKSRRSGRCGHC